VASFGCILFVFVHQVDDFLAFRGTLDLSCRAYTFFGFFRRHIDSNRSVDLDDRLPGGQGRRRLEEDCVQKVRKN
jgi:hypothetical protein